MDRSKWRFEGRTLLGLILIFFGILFFLDATNIINVDVSIGTFWPLVLIFLGVSNMIDRRGLSFWGILLVLLGVYYQLRNLNIAWINEIYIGQIFWPIVLILFGGSLLFSKRKTFPNNEPGGMSNSTNKYE